MTVALVEKARQVGLTFATRWLNAVELLDAQILLPKGAIEAYAFARLSQADTRDAVLEFYLGPRWRTPAAGWNIATCEAWGDYLVARFEAAEASIRAKAVRS